MKLAEAVSLAKESESCKGDPFRVFVACGFTPQHLTIYLKAHLHARLGGRRVVVEPGRYGDLLLAFADLRHDAAFNAVAVFVEWTDLDPRLGFRTTHGWRPKRLHDIADTAKPRLEQLRRLVEDLAGRVPVYLVLPSLPLPPAFTGPTGKGDCLEFVLREHVMAFARAVSAIPRVSIVNPQRLDSVSQFDNRFDLGAALRADLPYSLEHASAVCQLVALLICPDSPKKGIITDLDDTLWRGILGEEGVSGISWELHRHAHGHALYQELLASLAEIGVMLGVATKNDPDLVTLALSRKDLVISHDQIFPVEAGWGSKSEAIRRILQAWNVGADSVVFVDDSPLELAEVSTAFPDVHCMRFPVDDDRALPGFLQHLRDLFGKSSVTEEDRLRLASIRTSTVHIDRRPGQTSDEFLASIEAEITLVYDAPNERAFELINKTNQFNLNGRRIDTAAWLAKLEEPKRFILSVSYRDKFGPLGNIAVVAGLCLEDELLVDVWVMSCRAFSRRIEFQVLKELFERFDAKSVKLEFTATDRNGPFQEFVEAFGSSDLSRITKAAFVAACPKLYAKVSVHE